MRGTTADEGGNVTMEREAVFGEMLPVPVQGRRSGPAGHIRRITCLPVNLCVQKEISLLGSQGYNWDFPGALTLLVQGCLDSQPLITHRVTLEELQSGFEILLDPNGKAVKVVVMMQ